MIDGLSENLKKTTKKKYVIEGDGGEDLSEEN